MLLRKIHKFAGAFFAPALLFFCVSGLLQTFDLHKVRAGVQPPRLVLELAALHKNQTLQTQRRALGPPPARAGGEKGGRGETPRPASPGEQLLKLFVAATSIMLGATTLAGVYMSLQPRRGRWLALELLAMGVAAPAALMLLM